MKTTMLFHTDKFQLGKPYFTTSDNYGGTKHTAYFLHSRESGDYNRVKFSKRPTKSTKSKTSTHLYFIPDASACAKEIESELRRGYTFFSEQEGFLFGAQVGLAKMGKLIFLPA
jgi:hypothetical protein